MVVVVVVVVVTTFRVTEALMKIMVYRGNWNSQLPVSFHLIDCHKLCRCSPHFSNLGTDTNTVKIVNLKVRRVLPEFMALPVSVCQSVCLSSCLSVGPSVSVLLLLRCHASLNVLCFSFGRWGRTEQHNGDEHNGWFWINGRCFHVERTPLTKWTRRSLRDRTHQTWRH